MHVYLAKISLPKFVPSTRAAIAVISSLHIQTRCKGYSVDVILLCIDSFVLFVQGFRNYVPM